MHLLVIFHLYIFFKEASVHILCSFFNSFYYCVVRIIYVIDTSVLHDLQKFPLLLSFVFLMVLFEVHYLYY